MASARLSKAVSITGHTKGNCGLKNTSKTTCNVSFKKRNRRLPFVVSGRNKAFPLLQPQATKNQETRRAPHTKTRVIELSSRIRAGSIWTNQTRASRTQVKPFAAIYSRISTQRQKILFLGTVPSTMLAGNYKTKMRQESFKTLPDCSFPRRKLSPHLATNV